MRSQKELALLNLHRIINEMRTAVEQDYVPSIVLVAEWVDNLEESLSVLEELV